MTASHMSLRSTSSRCTATLPDTTSAAHASERSRKSAGSNNASATPSSCACAGRNTLRVNGFWMITWAAPTIPIRFGSSCEPPQPGISPSDTSGSPSAAAPPETVR